MKLSSVAAKSAKPGEKAYKLADGGGLYLEVYPNGSKMWRLKYRRAGGKETRVSLGPYPSVSIAEARAKREELKKQRREGVDPAVERKLDKVRRQHAEANSFEAVGLEWLDKLGNSVTPAYLKRLRRRFERDLFPYIGKRPIADLDTPELLAALQRIERRGAVDTAHRARAECGALFRYAIATGRARHDVSAALRGALTPHQVEHFPSITKPAEIGALLRALDDYQGTPEVRAALQLAPLVFVRPGELRAAEWSEFDLDGAEWKLPAHKMKMRAPHIVPLSSQAVSVLRQLAAFTGRGTLLFPSVRSRHRPMSENTVNAALRRLGYTREQMTGHGFRSMASTLLHEQGWKHEAIERQLAHAERDEVSAAYNYAEFLPERRKMMQAWGDYLDALRADRRVLLENLGRAA
jgi:integrase